MGVERVQNDRVYNIVGVSLKDWVHVERVNFMESLLPKTRAGLRCGRRVAAGSFSAPNEWPVMSHQIDAIPPAPPSPKPW